jgi:hypothetical protein
MCIIAAATFDFELVEEGSGPAFDGVLPDLSRTTTREWDLPQEEPAVPSAAWAATSQAVLPPPWEGASGRSSD